MSTIVSGLKEIPEKASIDYTVPFILDQKNCPFCAGFAMDNIGNALFNNIGKMPNKGFSPSFTYWKAKEIDGLSGQDGTTLRAVLDVSRKWGFLPWEHLPFTGDCKKPKITDKMLAEASKYKIKGYAKVNNFNEICQAIAAGKFVIIGTIVTSVNWADGWILEPSGWLRGGHATIISQYDMNLTYKENGKLYEQFLGGDNSWSEVWGIEGKYWMAKYYTEYILKDFGNTPCLLDAYAVDFDTLPEPKINDVTQPKKEEKIMKMSVPMQVIPPGHTMLGFRSIYEALGAKVEWGKNEKGKIWARAIIPPIEKEIIIETVQDSDELKIIK